MPKPPVVADLTWSGDLRFLVTFGAREPATPLVLDGAAKAGPSPVDALIGALVGCMSADVAYTLSRGRHPVRAIRAHLVAQRAQQNPHRIVSVAVHFTVDGDLPTDAVARAIALSREKYCSVWHSMRQDIDLATTYDVNA